MEQGRLRSLMSDSTAVLRGRVGQSPPPLQPGWEPTPGQIGICCSGGGIRSASYNLGALQALQELGILQQADYLASVSGGGYIAGAMTMVATSEHQDLVWEPHPPPFARQSPEERHLRNHSSYLAYGRAGMARLVGRVLLGLLINVTFLGAMVTLAARAAGHVGAWLRPELVTGTGRTPPTVATGGVVLFGVLLLAVGFVLILVTGLRRLPARHEDRLVLAGQRVLLTGLSILGVLLALPWVLGALRGASGRLLDLLDWAAGLVGAGDGAIAATPETTALTQVATVLVALGIPALLGSALKTIFTEQASRIGLLAGGLLVPVLVAAGFLAVANDAAGHGWTAAEVWWFAVPAALLAGLWAWSDLTAGSLHPFYKRRLCSAFALERIWRNPDGDVADTAEERHPAGRLDARERQYDLHVPLSQTCPPEGRAWPKLVCCAAANITDEGATPPGRRAVTFTFDPDWVGGPEVGYVPTGQFERVLGPGRAQDITLPAAVAVSGAALSPSMGSLTRPAFTLLLALVNARLGVWLPNPRRIVAHHLDNAQREALLDEDPRPWRSRPRFTWLWREMRGHNAADGRFLYVTDGGHWENLGLVELLRRGCTEIYCFDAAGDKEDTFFTIGQAIALARSELGVDITVDPADLRPADGDTYAAEDHVVGTITFPPDASGTQPAPGRLVFAKLAVTRDAPWDVRAYKEKDARFPNHSLLQQMFPDQTFESYRALGYHTACRAVASMKA
jgi:hypothetical protein